jgi:hypothetical protein
VPVAIPDCPSPAHEVKRNYPSACKPWPVLMSLAFCRRARMRDAPGLRRTEASRLKESVLSTQRRVIRVRRGKGLRDRDDPPELSAIASSCDSTR